VSSCGYFYEAIISFAREPIPIGDGYEAWVKEKQEDIRSGNTYFLGELKRRPG